MNYELEIIAGFIARAQCPEDIFGNLGVTPRTQEAKLKHAFRQTARVVHPDRFVGLNGDVDSRVLATNTFAELENIREVALGRIRKGTYGAREPLPGRAPVILKGRYVRTGQLAVGDIADLHVGYLESSTKRATLAIKVARKADDNDLLKAEAEALDRLHSRLPEATWGQCVPHLLESFLLDEPGRKRRVNVLDAYPGFYDGETIRRLVPKGLDGRTVAWMWKRLLLLLEWTNKIGLVHGAVLPPHVMFYPDNDGRTVRDPRKHAIRLVDWCYAVDPTKRTRLSAWLPGWKELYAPEVLEKKPLGPWTDLYMGATTIMYLAGGYFSSKAGKLTYAVPDAVHPEIAQSILACVIPEAAKRPQSIGKYFEEFVRVLKKVYGAPKYHDFNLPGAEAHNS